MNKSLTCNPGYWRQVAEKEGDDNMGPTCQLKVLQKLGWHSLNNETDVTIAELFGATSAAEFHS